MARAPLDEPPPEPDRRDGAPHPREATGLFGHAREEWEVLGAIARDRVHSGWLITGPEGIGKATFAYRMAESLVSGAEADPDRGRLGLPPDHPDARLVRAGSHPRLFVLRRGADDKGNAPHPDHRGGRPPPARLLHLPPPTGAAASSSWTPPTSSTPTPPTPS
jgi:DNA polymerase-3 subunit delta'